MFPDNDWGHDLSAMFRYIKSNVLQKPVEPYTMEGYYMHLRFREQEFYGTIIIGSNGLFIGGTHEPGTMREHYPLFGKIEVTGDTRVIEFLKLKSKSIHTLQKDGIELAGTYIGHWEKEGLDRPLEQRSTFLVLKKVPGE